MAEAALKRLTVAEFLEFEDASETKHEFYDGEIFAMAGASPAHVEIAANLFGGLYSQLRGGPCRPRGSDQRVRVTATGLYTYPDLTIVCDVPEYALEDPFALLNPTVIIEILSPSTERYDRTVKFDHYTKITSLSEYVLVYQDQKRIEVFRRGDHDWTFEWVSDDGQAIPLRSVSCRLEVAQVYEGVVMPEPTQAPTTVD